MLLTVKETAEVLKISESTLYQIRKKLFDHLEKLPVSFFDQNKKGDIMSRFTNDVAVISDALTDALMQIISGIITLVGVSIIMFAVNWVLAITTIITSNAIKNGIFSSFW